MHSIDDAAVLNWFTGKALADAREGLALLHASIEHGSWLPKASRRVAATLCKANVVAKATKPFGKQLEALGGYDGDIMERGWAVRHAAQFGSFRYAQSINFAAVKTLANLRDGSVLLAIDTVERWAKDFAPVSAAIARLDVTKPVPTFTQLGVSPTVTRTLADLGVVGSIETLRVCPIKWEKRERVINGKVCYYSVGIMLWPAGTKHSASRHGNHGCFTHCEACGHAIRNSFNWVPLLIDNAQGVPHSMWVGRDCSKNLFGIDMQGELELGDLTGTQAVE